MISFCGAFVCKTPASQKNTCHFLYNNSAMEGASIVCIKTRGFSPENPSSKMARRPFLRGFPPFASAHCRIRGNYGAPIPAVLKYATIASTGSFRKKTPRASLLAPIPAVLEYATNLNSHTCLQTGTQFANKRLACKQVPRLQTNASHSTNTPKANQRTPCKPAHTCKQTPRLQTNTTLANKHHTCNKHHACKQPHLTQTGTPLATNTPLANKHT